MSQILEDVKKSGRERAYVMINCEDDSMQYVMDQLKSILGITEIQSTIGPYDIVTKIECSIYNGIERNHHGAHQKGTKS